LDEEASVSHNVNVLFEIKGGSFVSFLSHDVMVGKLQKLNKAFSDYLAFVHS
jgi:hypothetical protein